MENLYSEGYAEVRMAVILRPYISSRLRLFKGREMLGHALSGHLTLVILRHCLRAKL